MSGKPNFVLFGRLILALIALIGSAYVHVDLPSLAVPFTLQTVVILIVGYMFDIKWALVVVLLYLILGVSGLPVFASAPNSMEMITSKSAGYLIGFVPAIIWVNNFSKSGKRLFFVFVFAHIIILMLGMVGLIINKGLSIELAFLNGFQPFLPGAFIKSILTCILIKVILFTDLTKING